MKSVYNDPAYQTVAQNLKTEIHRLQKQYKVPNDQGSVPKDPPSLEIKKRR